MEFDFSAILLGLTVLFGVVWGLDRLFLYKQRKARLDAAGTEYSDPVPVDWARSLFPVVLVVLLLRTFVAEPFRIPSGSMMPTLDVGDFILVNKFAYGLRLPAFNNKVVDLGEPKRGDVVVFRFPGFLCDDGTGKPARECARDRPLALCEVGSPRFVRVCEQRGLGETALDDTAGELEHEHGRCGGADRGEAAGVRERQAEDQARTHQRELAE